MKRGYSKRLTVVPDTPGRDDSFDEPEITSPERPTDTSTSPPIQSPARDALERGDAVAVPAEKSRVSWQLTSGFLQRCAARWPQRSGALMLQEASAHGEYERLASGDISEDEAEQLRLDVERSSVDGLEDFYVANADEASLREALLRVLRAWSCRQPGGYCQGHNFVAMVLLVVMQHAMDQEGWSESGARHAEESAFWVFVAIVEQHLPSDFYSAPTMAGLQRDVRVLYELFLLARDGGQLPTPQGVDASGGAIRDEEWRDILKLTAYRWFVPWYINQLPLPTLLLCWDRLLFRVSPSANAEREVGLSTAHLSLALALIHSALEDAGDAVAASRSTEEGLGLGFDNLLQAALQQHDGHALIATAARFEITPRQLSFVRASLSGEQPGRITRSRRIPGEPAMAPSDDPRLSALQIAALWLMAVGRSESLPVRLLKHTFLQPPPSPIAVVRRSPPAYYSRLVSTCSLMFAAFCLQWTSPSAPFVALGPGAHLP
jgi:hypothetical protein